MTKSKIINWADNAARLEEGRSSSKILTGKPAGKRSLGRPILKRIDISTRNWADSIQDRDYWRILVNVTLNPVVP